MRKSQDLIYLGMHIEENGLQQTFNITVLEKIKRLARKHHRLAEMSCNGVGTIKGVTYYNGAIDDYARRTYGQNVKQALIQFVDADMDIFEIEQGRVSDKINALVKELNGGGPTASPNGVLGAWKVEYQGDPRGNTVKLYCCERWINLDLF